MAARFKQPDKSNCPFCLWFILFFYSGLFTRVDWELKMGTCSPYAVWTQNHHPPPSLQPHPRLHCVSQLTGHQSVHPKWLLDGSDRKSWRPLLFFLKIWLFGLFLMYFILWLPLLHHPTTNTTTTTFWLFCIVDRALFKCLGVVISSGVNGSVSNELSKEFILIVL